MPRLSTFVFASLLLLSCGGDDGDEGSGDPTNGDQTTDQGDGDGDDGATDETGAADPVCFPEGIYGPCSANLCQCVLGGDLYQSCTKSCTDASECGDPADFPGATPACTPDNPGSENKICTLQCTTTADCPCGLECQATYLICTEPQ